MRSTAGAGSTHMPHSDEHVPHKKAAPQARECGRARCWRLRTHSKPPGSSKLPQRVLEELTTSSEQCAARELGEAVEAGRRWHVVIGTSVEGGRPAKDTHQCPREVFSLALAVSVKKVKC